MASEEERDRNFSSSRSRNLESPFVGEDLFIRETDSKLEANLADLEAESPFMHAFEQGESNLAEPEEQEEEFAEEDWTYEENFYADEAEVQVKEEQLDWEDSIADLEEENPFYTDREDTLFEDEGLLEEEAFLSEMGETATGFIPMPVEPIGGGRIKDKRDPPPAELETLKGYLGKTIRLHRLAATAWRALVAAARKDGIREPLLQIISGYRDSSLQANLFRTAVKRYGSESAARKWVAPPGRSPHHSGRAVDFYLGGKNNSNNVASLRQKPAYLWLVKNAQVFGFYPYDREPWHWEYNPPASKGRLQGKAPVGKPVLPGSVVPMKPTQHGTVKQIQQGTTKPIQQGTAKPSAESVRFAQRILKVVEGEQLNDDGKLDQLTRAALERFRKKYNLGTGGVLDASTVLALAQRALEKLAQSSMFAKIGKRDAKTEQAITTFKAAHMRMDSRLDAPTLRALTDALARTAPKLFSGTSVFQKPALISPSNYLGGKLWTFEAKTLPTKVAVFCPPAALSKKKVEVLVFTHGLLNGCRRPKSIPDGIITEAPFKLGDIVAASNRPLILVVPYLDWANPGGERAFSKEFRKWHALAKPALLNSLLAEVLAELGWVQGITAPSIHNLIIAGHSRAYDFLEPLAHSRSDPQMQKGALEKLSKVWAFDSTYTGNVNNWMSWLKANPRLRVSIFYEPGSKTGRIGDMFYRHKGGRLSVVRTKEGHCAVPARRLPELLKSPSFTADQETEFQLDEEELEQYEVGEDEDYDSEKYSNETLYNENVIDTEYEEESEDKYEEAGEEYASELYNNETFYDENVIDTEYEEESEDKYEEAGEDYASETYNDQMSYDENVIDTEYEEESEDKYETFELAEEQGFDSFESFDELDMYEQGMSSEPELDSFAFEALGSDSEYTLEPEQLENNSESLDEQEIPVNCPPLRKSTPKIVYGWSQYKRQVKELPFDQQAVLKDIGNTIKLSYEPRCRPVKTVQVFGHADWDTPRTPKREQQMSEERAQIVANWLKNYVGNQIANQIVWNVQGLGATQLKKESPRTEKDRRQNRRVEITLEVGCVDLPPGTDLSSFTQRYPNIAICVNPPIVHPPPNISNMQAIDIGLKDLIDKYAPIYYRNTWKISLSEYKSWIALITLHEAARFRYGAHSGSNTKFNGDCFSHESSNVRNIKFHFSTGIGAFQLDRGGEWSNMPTIDKLDPEKSLLSTLKSFYKRYEKGRPTLSTFSSGSSWYAVKPDRENIFSPTWRKMTGCSWNICKDTKKNVSFNPPTVKDPYSNYVTPIGKIYWNSHNGLFGKYLDTWLISARSFRVKGTYFKYYYTYDQDSGWESWVWDDPNRKYIYRFDRKYALTEFPNNRKRKGNLTVAGVTDSTPAFNLGKQNP